MFTKKKQLLNSNSYGGFDLSQDEFVIYNRLKTPQPWINICTNPEFGTLITESGSMFSWYQNSHLYKITSRVDDAVTRQGGETIYLKDDASGEIWQPTKESQARHGKGYTIFESQKGDLQVTLTVLVSIDKPLKMIKLELTNNSHVQKIISTTYYNQFVLGEAIERTKQALRLDFNDTKKQIVAQNSAHPDFPETKVILGVNDGAISYDFDRAHFFGETGTEAQPEALYKFQLPNKDYLANDPCAALNSLVRIPPGKTKSIIFYLGVDVDLSQSRITEKYFNTELQCVKNYWKKATSQVEIKTPNLELDILFNRQLLYQVISSRLWGRTGLYQPGGAFGYRDQLQDVISLCWSQPDLARKHILLAASRQFFGGGVQHWWHPPGNAGVRSLSSDAHLWLVHTTLEYIKITGDMEILTEKIPFLLTDKLEHHSRAYLSPDSSEGTYSLFEHCQEALHRTIYLLGRNGLPLILAGDWNDSLDLVGRDRQGESVWLAMFLAKLCVEFSSVAKGYKGQERADYYLKISETLKERVEKKCWDGEWYLRAFWDSGEPLGGKTSEEMMIDSLSQSWSIIAGFNKKRSKTALEVANRLLIDRRYNVVKLFTPPFQKIKYDPGYILLYPPGVRENGGAYSHAAVWLAQANAISGNNETAMNIIDMLNPLKRTISDLDVEIYRGEPYVTVADIYTSGLLAGMAGWTWYTGSASLIYVTVLEHILGFKKRGQKIYLKPTVPSTWNEFEIKYRYQKALYIIAFKKSRNPKKEIRIDGKIIDTGNISLKNIDKTYRVEVTF